jgi:hypothetical protein
MKRVSYIISILLAALFIPSAGGDTPATPARDDESVELQVKAALIFRLASFSRWPDERFGRKSDPIRLTILGNRKLYETYIQSSARKIGKHPIKVSYADSPKDIEDSHILYVDAKQSSSFFAGIDEPPFGVLTIGDSEEFAKDGGIVQFSIKNNTLNLTVNVVASEKARIRVDTQVLEISDIYREP